MTAAGIKEKGSGKFVSEEGVIGEEWRRRSLRTLECVERKETYKKAVENGDTRAHFP